MTTIEKRNDRYVMVCDDQTIELTSITKDGKSLILPENEAGRQFMALSKLEKNPIIELTPIIRDGESAPKKPKIPSVSDLKDYVSDEVWNAIETASAKWIADHTPKPLTREEKLLKELEKVQKELDKIRNTREGA